MVTYDDVAAAHERIKGVAHRTPVLTSATANALIGARLFFKCENMQRMGAFKFRGAYNALSQLSAEERKRGVLAFSSGNHAQAVALAGKLLGIKTVIVMPENAPRVKLEATRGYGAEIVLYDRDHKYLGHWIERAKLADEQMPAVRARVMPPADQMPARDTPEWNALRDSGKWKDAPDYGKAKTGRIALQDHGSVFWFRNVKIRTIG